MTHQCGGNEPMHDIWKDMFVLGLPLLEKILRPVFVYAFLVIGLRLSGKRELVQLNPFDLVVLILDGKVQTRRLKKELITASQLEAAARKQGFASLSEVQECVLEPGGTLSFLEKKPALEELRHQELVKRLERLTDEIIRLRGAQPPARA